MPESLILRKHEFPLWHCPMIVIAGRAAIVGFIFAAGAADDLVNKITGAGAHVIINPSEIFSQQAHSDKKRTNEDKQNGK